jgi:DNA-binding Lrp family transcriptional regulator
MKTVMVVDDKASELLVDRLNQKMVRELVFSEYSIAELSRKLNIPPIKTWRRIQKLVEAKVVEVARVDKVKNLQKKIYRATATNFLPRQFLDLKPDDERLRKTLKTYLEIQGEVMNRMSAFSEIPEGVNPIDYAIYAAAKSLCLLFVDPDLRNKAMRLEREISEFEQDQRFQPMPRKPVGKNQPP